jgi:hypothetical protein
VSDSSISPGRGLYEVTEQDGTRWVTNLTRKVTGGSDTHAGRRLVNAATVLLGLLDVGLFAISLMAQYQYIFTAKHQSWPAYIEAVALDAAMIVFSLLALGLARAGQAAPVERFLILVCAFGSAAMNYAAADVSSPRSVAAYVMPPIALAIVTDRVIAVVRRHVLGMEAERSAWAALGRAILVVLAAAGKVVLYSLRLVLAPRSTFGGARSQILLATPLPGVPAVRAALDPVRAALDGDLRELRTRYEATAANLDDSLRAAQQAFRTETEIVRETLRTETSAVRETIRTEIEAVREAARTEAPGAVRAALDPVRAALDDDLRELRTRYEMTAANLDDSLRAAQQAFRTETEAVRETLRTETSAVRETIRTEIEAVREAARTETEDQPPELDRDALVAELADRFRAAVSSGDRWAPDYDELMARTGYRRRWCEKAVQDARAQVLNAPGLSLPGESAAAQTLPSADYADYKEAS